MACLKREADHSTRLRLGTHIGLDAQEKSGQVDAYVRMTLYDPSTGHTEAFRTTTQINDPSPRFNQKFDFIDVPAISHFTASVYDKSGLIESRLTMTPWKQARMVTDPSHPCDRESPATRTRFLSRPRRGRGACTGRSAYC